MGVAVPVKIGRHAHPAARPELPSPPPAGSGIDYLGLVEARRDRADEQRISYAGIGPVPDQDSPDGPSVDPNQLTLPCESEHIGPGDHHHHHHHNEEGIR